MRILFPGLTLVLGLCFAGCDADPDPVVSAAGAVIAEPLIAEPLTRSPCATP